LELAKQVNEYQARLRAVQRKIMAAVSELSMYQVGGRGLIAVAKAKALAPTK
jgi:hypothetical protein